MSEIVTITMENGGQIKAELYPDKAPITVENFNGETTAIMLCHIANRGIL